MGARESSESAPRLGRTRAHQSRSVKQAVAQFKKTRSEVLEALSAQPGETSLGRLEDIGRDYASAFNRLDGRSPFIETEEREELFAALATVIDEFELEWDRSLAAERLALLSGVEDARDW